jgi:cytochrome c553
LPRTRTLFIGSLLLIILLFPGSALAAIDAESVVSGKCTACHGPERIRESAKTKAEWAVQIDKEINREDGVALSGSERSAVIDWLATNYGASENNNVEIAQVETSAASETLPYDKQADTGVELWQFLVTGGTLLAGGAWLRRR